MLSGYLLGPSRVRIDSINVLMVTVQMLSRFFVPAWNQNRDGELVPIRVSVFFLLFFVFFSEGLP